MNTVLCYGDSNTYGYNPNIGPRSRYEKSKRWTTILGTLLGPEYEVIAEGLNGRTTAYDRPGFPWKNGVTHLAPIMGSHKPINYLIFMLGTNDCNVEMGLSSSNIAEGMEKLVINAREVSMIQQESLPEIIIVSPAPIREPIDNSPFYGEINTCSVMKSKELASLYKSIAIKYDCKFVDASNIEVSPLDSEHLTENGHDQLARLIYKEIYKKWVKTEKMQWYILVQLYY